MATGGAANIAGMAFIPYYRHIMELLEVNQDLKHTAKGIFKQMACAAGGAAVGGVVMGPVGALVGGIAGSVYGYCNVETYDSMVTIIRNLSDYEKKELVRKVQELVGSSGLEALTTFVGQQVNREILLNVVRQFANEASKKGG
ncbi:unnamed protein product [Owenia fusiformis]|uniref:Uncharacterized protein n=1 Tax=Owenia fusiformis TaxID=6347 RepID=A0A8J1XG26_OWEFU|nr:unnamed protein product [Owenia fusiformis]